MRTLTSLSALTAALAAGLGLQACGGSSTSSRGDTGGTGAKAGAAGANASAGATSAGESAGGAMTAGTTSGGATTAGTTSGGATTGGTTAGGTTAGGTTTTGGATNWPCKNPVPVLDTNGKPTGLEQCETGGNHRTEAIECVVTLPRAEACQTSGVGTPTCEKDDDCTDKLYGTCSQVPQAGTCQCNYGCRTDADCSGGVCLCGASVGYCQSATCRTDDDCVPGYQCRTFQDPTTIVCGFTRFECQMPGDTCESNANCAPTQYCMADAKGEHHCKAFSCGTPGRPFLIDGCAVTALVEERCDWLDEGAPNADVADLAPAARQALAEHYSRAAQLEHASIAAFARFTLQLLELGAPAQLVACSQQALADELEHAKTCFGLASRFAGRGLGPAGLPIAGCLEETALADVLRLAVREGCIGETVAAAQASEAYAHATDLRVRRALFDIQRDETRHAELAFRFVRWALERDASLQVIVLDELESAQRRTAQLRADEASVDLQCVAFGLLPAAHLVDLERRAVDDVVALLLRELITETARAA